MKTFTQSKFYLFALSFVLGILLMASCSSTSVADYIPDDAVGVACINFKSIAEKGELDNVKNMSMIKELREEIREEDTEIDNLIGNLMDDPASCGLDLREQLAMAVFERHGDAVFEWIAKMNSTSKFENFIQKNNKGSFKILQNDGFSYIDLFDGDAMVVWNDNVAMLLVPESRNSNLREDAKELLNLSKDRSIASNDNFAKFWGKKCDAGIYLDLGNMMREPDVKRELKHLPTAYMDGFEKSACYGTLNFEKGEIVLHMEALNFENQYYKDLLGHPFNANLLQFMPNKALAAATLSFDMTTLTSMINNEDAHLLKEEFYNDYTIGDVLNCFNGSIAASLSGIKEGKNTYVPTYVMTADLSNPSKIKKILDDLSNDANSGMRRANGCYVIGDEVYVAVNNDVLVISSEIDNLKPHSNGLQDVAADAKSGFFAYLDLNINNYPSFMTNNLSNESKTFLQSISEKCVLKRVDDHAVDVTLTIPSGSQNTLAYILKLMDNYFYKFYDILDNIDDSIGEALYSNRYDYATEVEETIAEEVDDDYYDYYDYYE